MYGTSVVNATFFIQSSTGKQLTGSQSLTILCESAQHIVNEGRDQNILFGGYITGDVGRYLCEKMGFFHPPAPN